MSAYPKDVARAAKWIWDRKEESIDWNWPVLTKRNSAKDTLGFSDIKAFQIFTILEKRGLIEPLKFTGKNGILIETYKLILKEEKDWKDTEKLGSFLYDWILNPLKDIFTDLGRALIWFLSVAITAVITVLITKWLTPR